MEYVCVAVRGSGVKLLVVAVYRPPASAIGSFLDEFADLLERVTTYSSVVIVGDLNIHLDVDTDPGVVKFQSLPNMQQIGFGFLSDPALMQGSLLRTVLHRGHMCSLEIQVLPLVVFWSWLQRIRQP